MSEISELVTEIERFCRDHRLAESTFGRLAVGNSKLMSRLRNGQGVTLRTVDKIRLYMQERSSPVDPQAATLDIRMADISQTGTEKADHELPDQPFSFYHNRQKYLTFVNTCNEKPMIANRAAQEFQHIQPRPPGLRILDAGVGDGTLITQLMRNMHHRHPSVPFFINAKEISDENVRLFLSKLPDRFFEHPAMVVVITNLRYPDAPSLKPSDINTAAALKWKEVGLRGRSSFDFADQIEGLEKDLKQDWQTQRSSISNKMVYRRPSVLVLYREDQRLLLDQLIPRVGTTDLYYDLILASHPWSAQETAKHKVENILAPLTRSLAAGGRLLVVQGYGDDPGNEILNMEWPDANPFPVRRHELVSLLKSELGRDAVTYNLNVLSDNKSLFQYRMHTIPSEISESLGTSTLLAAWNAVIYVGQIEDQLLQTALNRGTYLQSTRDVMRKHSGLWFNNECFVISKRRA